MGEDWYSRYQVCLPEGVQGPWRVEKFTITPGSEMDLFNLRLAIHGSSNRGVSPGEYTCLVHNKRGIVMSDTPAEIQDHRGFFWRVEIKDARRVLINGLGLGMSLRWALLQPHVEHVDVVEIDKDVIDLVGSHYTTDDRLTIHHGDAYTYQWPRGIKWDVAWHDIWDNITTDNLEGMEKLNRRYGHRVYWQSAWQIGHLKSQKGSEDHRRKVWGVLW